MATIAGVALILLGSTLCAQATSGDKKSRERIDKAVEELLSRMTLEEKLGQLQCEIQEVDGRDSIITKGIGSLAAPLRQLSAREAAGKANRIQKLAREKTRLKIPVLIHDEGVHGLWGNGATSYPQAIALASTWDPDLLHRVASNIAVEARTRGIRQLLSPVINIARDVRWGRVEETYGEDPYLTSRLAVAFCKGLEEEGVISTPKHFAANIGDGGRDSYPINFSERLLREIYFPAFKACIQEAHAGSVMAAYNSLNGLPCSGNRWLLTDILRKEWGFDGFVVSDYGSVSGMVDMHRVVATDQEAAVLSLNAGLDVELPNIYIYGSPLSEAVKSGTVSQTAVDSAVRRVLSAKFRLGVFENPFVDPNKAAIANDAPEHRALALQAAREGIVLLRNEQHCLPLKKSVTSIAVIGPNGNAVRLGGYSGFGTKAATLLEALRNKVPHAIVGYAKATDLKISNLVSVPGTYLYAATVASGVHGLHGEYFNNMNLSGPPALVRTENEVDFDWGEGSPDAAVQTDHFSVRWTGKLVPPVSGRFKLGMTTDDGVRLFLDDKLLIDSWIDRGPTSDETAVHLEAGHEYSVRMEYYENGYGAVARFGWDYKPAVDTMMQAAVALARKSDVAIVAVGVIEGEGSDRANLDLPGKQEELIRSISETGTPTVVVLMNGSAVTMANWSDRVSAIVEAWYPGEEGGNALADVLFGDYNPSGKLPITFPRSVGQVPLYYNHGPTGRGDNYIDMSGTPQFPFGFGLSYTTFEYSNIEVIPQKMNLSDSVTVRLQIKNTGMLQGKEIVQLYLRDVVSSVASPVLQLRRFKKIDLRPGQSEMVEFTLTPDDLAIYDAQMNHIVEPGEFEVLIGSSSQDIRLKKSFIVKQ
ncbi:MAG TPA: glycoside hydrolase family 3 N-terminal domain-containing protein [Bacteroidota bacterium]|nr:glycoside hydrolase family 3 N-terminal domain-containing protein [Bacteroidota bacterium]